MGDWTYEAKDFLMLAPYEVLYQFYGQPFVHEIKLQELSVYATSQGFCGFKSIYKKYIESLKARAEMVYVDNVTNFTGQLLELNMGDWDATGLGIYHRNGFADELACPHPIMLVERLINIDIGEEKLKLTLRKGTLRCRLTISKMTLVNANEVTKLAGSGIVVTSRSIRAFVQYISDLENLNYDTIPERKCVGRLGYIQDEGFSPFVEGLIFDNDANFKALFSTVRPHGGEQKRADVAREMRGMFTTARIILVASFASVLLESPNCLPFLVYLWGIDSSTGKTVALMMVASVWGDPTTGSYVRTFDGTVVGPEKIAVFPNDLPLCLDKLQLVKDVKRQTHFDVYKLVQGAGCTRGSRAGGVDLTPIWRNCILTTGEFPLTGITSGAGAVNRVIDTERKASSAVARDGMRISGIVKRNYGSAGHRLADELYKYGIIPQAEERYKDLFKPLSDRDTAEEQAMAAAAIICADELVRAWVSGGIE